jgi:hypothetical protein
MLDERSPESVGRVLDQKRSLPSGERRAPSSYAGELIGAGSARAAVQRPLLRNAT